MEPLRYSYQVRALDANGEDIVYGDGFCFNEADGWLDAVTVDPVGQTEDWFFSRHEDAAAAAVKFLKYIRDDEYIYFGLVPPTLEFRVTRTYADAPSGVLRDGEIRTYID